TGTGTFMPTEKTNPYIGKALKQEQVEEDRVEVIFPAHLEGKMVQALKKAHPYEEAAYYLTPLHNENQEVGSGMIGELDVPLEPIQFLRHLKNAMNLEVIRHTQLTENSI